EQRAIQSTAREFASRELAPFADAWDRDATLDTSVIRKLAELGFLGMMVPERYEGLGLDTLTYLVALEEIAAVDASTAVLMSVHNSLPTQMLLRWGTEEQKSRFLKPMARGELLGAFALSEPDSGSDAASLRMQATRDGGRLGIAAQAVGIAQAALSHASKYAAERRQFGKPIKEFQAIQFRLADMAMKVAASRALLHAAATARDRGQQIRQFSAMAKL